MRLLVLCFALLSSGLMVAQNNSIEVYPWNPDANNDNAIGATDILSTLAVYGNEFGTPPEPCDYDGTPLEEWWGQVISGDIVVDSLFMEFLLIDSAEVYYPGCPEPVMEVVELAFAEMLVASMQPSPFTGMSLTCTTDWYGSFFFLFTFMGSTGEYSAEYRFSGLNSLGFESDGIFGGDAGWTRSESLTLPFPGDMTLDENGIHLGDIWSSSQWPYYANYMHILPYWHYAE